MPKVLRSNFNFFLIKVADISIKLYWWDVNLRALFEREPFDPTAANSILSEQEQIHLNGHWYLRLPRGQLSLLTAKPVEQIQSEFDNINWTFRVCSPLAAFTLNLNLRNDSSVSKLHFTSSYNAWKDKKTFNMLDTTQFMLCHRSILSKTLIPIKERLKPNSLNECNIIKTVQIHDSSV